MKLRRDSSKVSMIFLHTSVKVVENKEVKLPFVRNQKPQVYFCGRATLPAAHPQVDEECVLAFPLVSAAQEKNHNVRSVRD